MGALFQVSIPLLRISAEGESRYEKHLRERIGDKRANRVFVALSDLQFAIEEANLLTQDLIGSTYVFRPQVLTDVARIDQDPQWMVSLHRAEAGVAQGMALATWSADDFSQRLNAMRLARDEVNKRGVRWGQPGDPHLWAQADVMLEVETHSGDVAGVGT